MKKDDQGKKFVEMLSARGKRNDMLSAAARADSRPIKEKAADRKADLEYGYPKVGVKFGTVDYESGGEMRESARGSRVTKSPVSGVTGGPVVPKALDNVFRKYKR